MTTHVRPALPASRPAPATRVRGRHPAARRHPGVLRLAVLALVAALLSGCSLIPGASSGTAGSGASDSAAGGSGDSWIVFTRGSATPAPTLTYGPSPTPIATSGFRPLSAPRPIGTPVSTCSPNTFNFSRIGGLDVVPGATSAVLSWYNVGGYNLREFRLYAISQDLVTGKQRDVGFVTVAPMNPCGQMTGTITNLSPKTAYVFSVDAVVTRKSGDGTHAATIARSHPVVTG